MFNSASVRRRIGLIEGNAKCRHFKNWQIKGLSDRCLSVWRPEPHIPPPYTLYTLIQYSYSHRERGSGGGWNLREGERGNSSQSWVENTNMTDCISSLWNLVNTCRWPLPVNFFRWRHLALVSIYLISSCICNKWRKVQSFPSLFYFLNKTATRWWPW